MKTKGLGLSEDEKMIDSLRQLTGFKPGQLAHGEDIHTKIAREVLNPINVSQTTPVAVRDPAMTALLQLAERDNLRPDIQAMNEQAAGLPMPRFNRSQRRTALYNVSRYKRR